jgi:gluconokinase
MGLWCYRVDRAHALVGGATSEGGNVYAWLREMLRLGDLADVEAALAIDTGSRCCRSSPASSAPETARRRALA